MAEGNKATIGVIGITIQGNADNASKSIKKLTGHLDGLKSALNTVKNAAFALGLKKIGTTIYDLMQKQSSFMQSMQNFKNIMHDTTGETQKFIDTTEQILGFDPKQTMDTMSTFQRLAEGFGISSDNASLMSRNLTQLAMDMTTTGLTFEAAGQKLRSGFAGEIEPMRAFGVALDKVTLQQTLYKLGIDRTFDSLSRAQKTELIYYQIMTQTANLQGTIAQQAISPATAFRLVQTSMERLARSAGSVFIPIFMKIIPVVLAVTKVLDRLAQRLAELELFGFKIGDYVQDFNGVSSSLGGISDGLDDVGGSAKKANKELQKMLMPFDELNNVNFETGKSSGIGSGLENIGGSLGIDLPNYDLLSMLDENGYFGNIDDLADRLMRSLPNIADAIAGFFLILGKAKIAGGIEVITGLSQIITSIKDIVDNGPNFNNVTEIIEGLGRVAGGIGLMTGKWKLAVAGMSLAWLTDAIQEIVRCWDAIKQGDWDGVDKHKLVLGAIGAITLIGMTVWEGYQTWKKFKGLKDTKKTLDNVTNATKAVSDVDGKIAQASPTLKSLVKNLGIGILIIGEVIIAGALIVGAIWGLGKALEQIGIAWQPVIDNEQMILEALGRGIVIIALVGVATYGLGQVGTELIKNLGLGIAVLALVEASTALFIGGIWAIGWGLGKVLEAWIPVLANGDLVLTSIVAGTAILIAIGAATALLGIATVGTGALLPLAILAGALMLAELELVALEFIIGIQAIGVGLGQILIAWAPVLANGNTVAQAILWGTALLVSIGGASAALGVASIASVGLLPLAIALGTKMLQQLTNAVIDFIRHLSNISRELTENLAPQLKRLNSHLPETNENLKRYIDFMKEFAGYTVDFTKASAVSGFANAVKTIIGWFAGNPIQNFANDVNKNYREVVNLNNKLRLANAELATAILLLRDYFTFLAELDRLTGRNNTYKISSNMFINMKEVGRNLVLGFVDGMRAESWQLNNTIDYVLQVNFNGATGYYYGLQFGYNIARGIANAMRSSYYPTLISSMRSSYGSMSISFRAYADGGFPENGQLFLANENGPELIGNIGNRTAVANNDQIVESLESGTYNAVSRAFRENQSNNNTTPPHIDIHIGNDKVYSGYGKYKNQASNMYGVRI